MKSKARRAFTLFEMLIVITIIALVGGVIAVGINRSLYDQRFRTEVATITNTLRLAQDLMLVLKDDVSVKFAEEKGKGIKFWLETDSPLTQNWEREIKRSHKTLRAIHSVAFRDELIGTIQHGEIDIKFLSNGSVMSRGVLRLSSSADDTARNALRSSICLYGYPHPISAQLEKEWGEVCLFDKNEVYNERLTDITVQEVMLVKQAKEEEKKAS